jgi:hypothetical protein
VSIDGGDKGSWSAEDLPPGWGWVSFNEFWTDHTDSKRKIPQNLYLAEGTFPVIDQGATLIGGYANDGTKKSLAPLPVIIFGDHTRAIKYFDRPFIQGADGVRVLCAAQRVDPLFAYHALRCVQLPDKGYSRHFRFLKATQFPLAPLPEQHRIVAKIDSLSAKSKRARERLDHIPRLVEKYKQAILAAAFSGELTQKWRSAAKVRLKSWSECSLGEIAEVGTGSTPKRGERRFYAGGKIPWITSGAVNAPIVRSAQEFITDAAIRETNCKVFPAGTLLMAMYGEGQTRGRVAVLGINAATNQALAAIQVKHGGPLIRDFLLWYLRSTYLELRQKAAGGVQPNLNLGIIKALQLPLPSQEEQNEAVRLIDVAFSWIDRFASETTSARRLIDHLDQSILAKAFRGELVPQDPNDEPASVLLERIKAQREAKSSTKRPTIRKKK